MQTNSGEAFAQESIEFDHAVGRVVADDLVRHLISKHINYERWNYENDLIREACGE